MKEKDKRPLGDDFIASDVKISNVTEEESTESCISSFVEGSKALAEFLKKKKKRRKG